MEKQKGKISSENWIISNCLIQRWALFLRLSISCGLIRCSPSELSSSTSLIIIDINWNFSPLPIGSNRPLLILHKVPHLRCDNSKLYVTPVLRWIIGQHNDSFTTDNPCLKYFVGCKTKTFWLEGTSTYFLPKAS